MKFHTKSLFFITICLLKLVVCDHVCNPFNNYISNPTVLPYFNGIFYHVYSTTPSMYANPIFTYKTDTVNKIRWSHLTDSSGCCKLTKASTVQESGGYYVSSITTLPGCAAPFSQNIVYKPLFTNGAQLGGLLGGLLNPLLNALLLDNLCVIQWVCRPSLEGINVLCKKPTVSATQLTWIQGIAANLNITFEPVIQNASYANTPCIADFTI